MCVGTSTRTYGSTEYVKLLHSIDQSLFFYRFTHKPTEYDPKKNGLLLLFVNSVHMWERLSWKRGRGKSPKGSR
jgi:hypothetical protein